MRSGWSYNEGPANSARATHELTELGGVPIDRMAWRVIQPGEHYERPQKLTELCFDRCPPTAKRDINFGNSSGSPQAKTVDLRGRRSGRLLVVGYWGRRFDNRDASKARIAKKMRNPGCTGLKSSKGLADQLWVCRCLCGLFCIRTAKTLMRLRSIEDADSICCDACYLQLKGGVTL